MTINLLLLNIYSLLPEIFLLLIICFSLVFFPILSNSVKFSFPILSNSVKFFVLMSLIFCFILLVNSSPVFMISWNNLLIFDYVTLYSKIIMTFFSIGWVLMFLNDKSVQNFEFWILILLSILALFLLLQSNDLLTIYINLEFLSLTFYILASLRRNSEFSTEAGLKYFILGAFASALLLFGFSLLYSFTGLTNLQDFFVLFNGNFDSTLDIYMYFGFELCIFCILTAFLFKLGVAPFHFWLPDVYEGAPIPITAFFAILPKLPILVLLIKFIFIIFYNFIYSEIYYYLLICTTLTSLIGTFGAFFQKKWKRFLAFSSISHLAFLLINICTLNPLNLINLFIYLFIYLFMTSSFFSFFNSIFIFKFPILSYNRFLSSIKFLHILNPILGFIFTVLLFSLAGIPPLVGFFAKFFVLFSIISQQFFGLVLFLLILNCVACFYYIRLINQIYFEDINKYLLPIYINFSSTNSFVLSFTLLIILLSFLNIDFFFLLANLMCLNFLN